MSNKSCKNCNAFNKVYREFSYFFTRFDTYYCSLPDEILQNCDGCELWQPKKSVIDFSKQRLDEVTEDIKVLKKYFKNI